MTKEIYAGSGGEKIFARVEGEGPLLILMHGWPELGLSWRHQIAPLVDAGYTVAVPDMRGYGKSSKPSEVGAYKLDLGEVTIVPAESVFE